MGFATLIVKGTRLCNLRCSYCHDWREGPGQKMPFEVLANLTVKALSDPTHNKVTFIWHGGEPTSLPISFYRKALLVQARFRRPHQLIENSLQTNALAMTPKWAAFLKASDIGVGVSLDGPPQIHDAYRRDVSGRASFTRVMRGIGVLREHGVKHSVLMVIDEDAYALGADAIFDFFLEHGITRFGFLAAKPANGSSARSTGSRAAHYIDPVRFNRFLMRMFDLWQANGDARICIRELDVIRRRIAKGPEKPCTLAGGCIGSYFVIDPNGEVGHCDLFLGDPDYTLGNILHDDFESLRRGAAIQRLRADNERALGRLAKCSEFEVCSGWCPHERYISLRHNPLHSHECCGLADLIRHIRRHERPAASRVPERTSVDMQAGLV